MRTPSLRREFLQWYDLNKRDLPWRRTRDPYAIWVSEVMLQQTQVTTVLPYYAKFLERFPTVAALAAASLPDVLMMWRGLGYYSRARNLHRAAEEIVARFGGVLPGEVASLRSLPSFGRYTTGAVASIAFGIEAPLVDGNVARVFARIFEVEGTPGDKAREATLWGHAETLVQGERPGDFNQALMELGAILCRPEEPLCLLCPVRAHCGALEHGRVKELPPAKVRAARKPLRLSVAVIEKRGKLLLGRRKETGLFGGLWELPCVEDSGLDRSEAFSLELGTVAQASEHALAEVKRTLTHRDLTLTLFAVALAGVPQVSDVYLEYAWVTPGEAELRGMSTAMQRAFAEALRSGAQAGDGPSGTQRRRAKKNLSARIYN